MNKLLKKFSTKISIYFFIISIVLVIILSYRNYKHSVNILKDNKLQQTEQQLKNASIYISSYLEKIKGISSLLAMTPEIENINALNENAIKKIIELTQQNDPLIKRISVISNDGKILSTSPIDFEISNNMESLEWYRNLKKSNNMAMVTTENHKGFSMNKTERVISISHEITNKNKKIEGFVVIDLSYKFIEDYVSSINFGENGYAFITTSEEKLLFDSKQMNTNSLIENEKYLKIIKDRMKTVEKGFIASKIYIPNTDWILVGVSSTEQIDQLQNKLIVNTVTWSIIILISTIALSVLISKWISKPLTNLVEEMKKVDESFSKIKIEYSDSIEIHTLKTEYNLLLDRIKTLTKNIEEKENSKRIFELKALQSQINPHFIYNTLDTILWLIEFGENEKAIEVTKSLGMILRSTLSINQDFISLSNELEHVKNYMDIQKVRYDDKFEYVFEIDKNTLEILVPKLILQPIVENAIYHGIKPKKSKSFIKISSYIDDEDLIIKVENNGVDLEFDNQNRIKTKLGGIGMSNVEQRIKILCGNQYGIRMYRQEDATVVEYRLSI
ncbi:sensor histidine kinase [Helcococcus ovis]|uniref:Sensor histidine kinase n=1 Tax=Helcococcus ovis TaxID=72026 RepID=A0A4V3IYG7_9FIRM|nr:sensor histidine kinase [Helcococcus ovis]TFF65526.1 sensor histidine kinase [Helcococcus ovis]TFF67631.1 sensor histidine kinase [Helcococcus ovis]